MTRPGVTDLLKKPPEEGVEATVESYQGFFDGGGDDLARRRGQYTTLVNDYYDLATDFYEFGWGDSFHFAPRFREERLEASLARHQHYMAAELGLRPGMSVADFGCGVGGPMRGIARFSGARVLGINNNDYQIARGRTHNERAGLSGGLDFLRCDYLAVPVPDASFDAAYDIEATAHAPDKRAVFAEVRRVLKPGGLFASYSWCLTDRFRPEDPEHRSIRDGICAGNALPDLVSAAAVLDAVRAAGFELLRSEDRALSSDPETPWYQPLDAPWYTLSGFRASAPGRALTHGMVRALETLRIAPKGATEVSRILQGAASSLVRGGRSGVFTPMLFVLARNPARNGGQR